MQSKKTLTLNEELDKLKSFGYGRDPREVRGGAAMGNIAQSTSNLNSNTQFGARGNSQSIENFKTLEYQRASA